ncbi:MAG: hypothetical protein LBS44_04185 [Deltaproteobacteria bacterium]|nr:hypothetical protein [Deltaproteobacteria bacterium]
MRKYIGLFSGLTFLVLALFGVFVFGFAAASIAQAQGQENSEPGLPLPPPNGPSALGQVGESGVLDATNLLRETLHLNTIGTYSAGFVLLSYGYIGVVADALGQRVYEPDVVNSMLRETVVYLNNANNQLKNYKNHQKELSEADLSFLSGISSIIASLIVEAEALADVAAGEEGALQRYNTARLEAWKRIKLILKVE